MYPGYGQAIMWHGIVTVSYESRDLHLVTTHNCTDSSILAIHSVDKVHNGAGDSSVMYIPACPLTEDNAEFVARQRAAFLEGVPCPDFGGGEGESNHVGKWGSDDVAKVSGPPGLRAFGLQEWDSSASELTQGQREALHRANKVLGFYD